MSKPAGDRPLWLTIIVRCLIALPVLLLVVAVPTEAAPPTISNTALSSGSVGQYEMLEVSADVQTVAANPYWPYDTNTPVSIPPGTGVTVDGLFSNDDWATTLVVPGFFYQRYVRHRVDGEPESNPLCELYTPVGKPNWCIRFAPESTGQWKLKVRVTDAEGSTTSPEQTFSCVRSNSHGFLRISPTDNQYFETSDGTALVGPGINGHIHSSYEAETILGKCGANGIRTVRFWMTGTQDYNHVFGGSYGQNWSMDSNHEPAYYPDSRPGHLFCYKIKPQGYVHQGVYLTAGKLYRVEGYVRTDSLEGGSLHIWIGTISGFSWDPSTARATGTTPWSKISFDFRPEKTGATALWIRNNGTSGSTFIDGFSIKESSDNGQTWSGEFISKGEFDTHTYMDQIEAAEVDQVFKTALANGVYLKTVVTEKWDEVLCRIQPDGSVAADRPLTPDNTYAADVGHPCRWLQRAWWRYMTARWGAFTSLHSWEWCNEGDPNNGHHYNAANAMADFVHELYPRRILCTTSFYQGPVQMELWKMGSCDYMDSHDYICTNFPGHNYYTRIYAPMDHPDGVQWDKLELPWQNSNGIVSYDSDVREGSTGVRSLKGVVNAGRGPNSWLWLTYRYHVGIDPTHKYTLKYWVKGDNIDVDPDTPWFKGGFTISWSRSFHENDFVPVDANTNVPVTGTYQWRQVVYPDIRPPADANTANLYCRCPANPLHTAAMWIDDVEFIDNGPADGSDPSWVDTDLMVGGGYEDDRMDYDIALGVNKFGVFYRSYGKRLGKPVVCGETGISTWQTYGNPYRGYAYTDEAQQLVDDTTGIHLRKFVWAHAGPYNPQFLYWWTDLLTRGNNGNGYWHFFGAFSNFMSDIRVSNGHFRDASASASNKNIRVLGQKDLVSNQAYLWIDNRPLTWKAVVDHYYQPEAWNSQAGYSLGCTCGSGTPVHVYRSLQNGNVNHAVSEAAWWEDLGPFDASKNPPLPPAVSGTVTVSGLRDGTYKVEWWDTTTGQVTRSEDVACSAGNLVLTINQLQSDIACKIRPQAPVVLLTISVPSDSVKPGQKVTVTVSYTNAGDATATNVSVKATIPEQMEYVAGSAEATGGVYNQATNTISWTIPSLASGEKGSRTFQAVVE
jgi:uncharacterized repeat protein (TIGR01451 family)